MGNNITDDRLREICKLGKGAKCCRYLACGANGFICLKNQPEAATIALRIKQGTFNATGDNCDGL